MWPPSRERRSYNANGNKEWKSIEATRIYDVEHIQRFAKGTLDCCMLWDGCSTAQHPTKSVLANVVNVGSEEKVIFGLSDSMRSCTTLFTLLVYQSSGAVL